MQSLQEITRRDLLRRETYQPPVEADYWLRVHRRAMACRFEVTLGGEDAADVPAARLALDQIDAIEDALTVFRDASEVVRVNRTAASAPIGVSRDLLDLLMCCRRWHEETGGAFDVTSTPLSRCWGFLRRAGRRPDAAEVAAALVCVGLSHVHIDAKQRTVAFDRAGIELNFGAVGKGWALDRVARTLHAHGVPRALLSAGRSSVRSVGSRPGVPWVIDLRSPQLERPLAHVRLHTGALGTSGAGEQFFEIDGKRYGHVIDPRTGWPADGPLSVSVLTESAAAADALSTAFFVGGLDLARRYCEEHAGVMAVVTPSASEAPVIVGAFDGAEIEVPV